MDVQDSPEISENPSFAIFEQWVSLFQKTFLHKALYRLYHEDDRKEAPLEEFNDNGFLTTAAESKTRLKTSTIA